MGITEIGRELRKLRVDRNERLYAMSQVLGLSTSFISAIETGRKLPPAGFEERVIAAYDLGIEPARRLITAGDQSRRAFVLEPKDDATRDVASLFARQLNTLSEGDLAELHKFLRKGKET